MIKVEIPNYLRRVKISNSRRVKYFETGDKLPLKYGDTIRYIWKKRAGVLNLYDSIEKEFVVKNPGVVGTPGYQSISGNEIYARMHERKRMMIVDTLKNHFKEHIEAQLSSLPNDLFPLSISMEVHSPYGYADWDVDNLWIYHKCFLDSIRDLQLIPDDNVLYITQAGQTTFKPISESEVPKMVFIIKKSDSDYPKLTDALHVSESSEGDPGSVLFSSGRAVMYTGKRKIIFGAAKDAVRKLMLHALNNFKTVFVSHDIYMRYKTFFDENRFGGKVVIIITPKE